MTVAGALTGLVLEVLAACNCGIICSFVAIGGFVFSFVVGLITVIKFGNEAESSLAQITFDTHGYSYYLFIVGFALELLCGLSSAAVAFRNKDVVVVS